MESQNCNKTNLTTVLPFPAISVKMIFFLTQFNQEKRAFFTQPVELLRQSVAQISKKIIRMSEYNFISHEKERELNIESIFDKKITSSKLSC